MSTVLSEPTHDILVEQNVPVLMRDGTVLRADVYRPQGEGQYPVLVGRVGYKLRDWVMDFYTPTGEYYARRGYVVVWQNVRGTFASEGCSVRRSAGAQVGIPNVAANSSEPGGATRRPKSPSAHRRSASSTGFMQLVTPVTPP